MVRGRPISQVSDRAHRIGLEVGDGADEGFTHRLEYSESALISPHERYYSSPFHVRAGKSELLHPVHLWSGGVSQV